MKSKVITLFVFLAPLMLAISARAGRGNGWVETGNGGFVMICPQGQNKVLDLHEAQSQLNMTLDQDEDSLASVQNRVLYILNHLNRFDPFRADIYKKWFSTFFEEAHFIVGQRLYPIPDVGFTYVPKECHLELAVFQREPDYRTKYRYTINGDIWSTLDITNQAALVLHELIYREASNFNNAHITSESTRYLNGWMHSTGFQGDSVLNFIYQIQNLNFQHAYFQGFNVLLGQYNVLSNVWIPIPINYHDGGAIKKISVTTFSDQAIDWIKPIHGCFENGFHTYQNQVQASASFDYKADLESIEFHFKPNKNCIFPYNDGERTVAIPGSDFVFYRDGAVEIFVASPQPQVLELEGVRIDLYFMSQQVRYFLNSERKLVRLQFDRSPCWSKWAGLVNFAAQSSPQIVEIGRLNETDLPACNFNHR